MDGRSAFFSPLNPNNCIFKQSLGERFFLIFLIKGIAQFSCSLVTRGVLRANSQVPLIFIIMLLAYSFIIVVLTFEWGARTHKSINSFGFWPIYFFLLILAQNQLLQKLKKNNWPTKLIKQHVFYNFSPLLKTL